MDRVGRDKVKGGDDNGCRTRRKWGCFALQRALFNGSPYCVCVCFFLPPTFSDVSL